MNCPLPTEALHAVFSYLRRTGQGITCENGEYLLSQGRPNRNLIAQAYQDGAITLTATGTLTVCGVQIPTALDTTKIRGRVEDHLRKSASSRDIIRIAACLGLRLR